MNKIYWFGCFVAYHLVLRLPSDWRIWWALLPHAGWHAYSDYETFSNRPTPTQR